MLTVLPRRLRNTCSAVTSVRSCASAQGLRFTKDFSQPDALPDVALRRVTDVLRSGRLFRYQGIGQHQEDVALEVCKVEQEFAQFLGAKYAMGLNSCGSAMFLALKASGLEQGDAVLVNTFTLHPVPSAIIHAGARPVFVETDSNLCIDLEDLVRKAKLSKARYLLLSHMRGWVADMDKLTKICKEHGICLIEDCAHALGAKWNGRAVGTFGLASCFSAQTNKLLNSGEGGFVTTDDNEIAARVILHSGSYGHYRSSAAVMTDSSVLEHLERLHDYLPNFSLRMTNIAAAILRPQIPEMNAKIALYNQHCQILTSKVSAHSLFKVPEQAASVSPVRTSFQFWIPTFSADQMGRFCDLCGEHGVTLAWFGRDVPLGFTSVVQHWQYIYDNRPDDIDSDDVVQADEHLSATTSIMSKMCDIPLYHTSTWTDSDFELVAKVLQHCADSIAAEK